jgi:VIT1/CCC1 family predicted Fe2+/Mn2+ transporter
MTDRSSAVPHTERHRTERIGWLRAAVLGANDGAVSVASVVVGVAAAPTATPGAVLLAGTAALVAGAMSMAAGEYVSVQSQADTEAADLARETAELAADPEGEREELAAIYRTRGLDTDLARRVADQLMAHDALGAHARDELGITEALRARPLQAALASAGAFSVGAALPLATAVLAAGSHVLVAVGAATVATLLVLGGLAAYAGGASAVRGALRVTTWGVLAMAATALIGRLVGAGP